MYKVVWMVQPFEVVSSCCFVTVILKEKSNACDIVVCSQVIGTFTCFPKMEPEFLFPPYLCTSGSQSWSNPSWVGNIPSTCYSIPREDLFLLIGKY